MRRAPAAGLVCLVLATAIAAQGQEPPGGSASRRAVPPAAPLHETYRSGVPVSGEVRVGVVAGETGLSGEGDLRLYVLVPTADASRAAGATALCLRLSSRDGRYVAEGKYRLSAQDRGIVPLQIASKYMEELRTHEEELYLAPFVTLSDESGDCDQRRDAVLLAGWTPEVSPDRFQVLINSGGLMTAVIGYREDRSTASFPCDPIEGTEVVTFDRICRVETGDDSFVRFAVRRREGGSYSRLPLAIVR